ncbi:MAG: leucine-rich repeat domain-containing protein [Candidatus Kariarchaeaceae archaeon]
MVDVSVSGVKYDGSNWFAPIDISWKGLDFRGQSLAMIDLSPLSYCKSLKELWLSNNQFKNIVISPLSKCISLEAITLSNNRLMDISLAPLTNCFLLKEISLSNNPLISIDYQSLQQCPNLEKINLLDTNIKQINLINFENFPSLKELKLDDSTICTWEGHELPPRESFPEALMEYYDRLVLQLPFTEKKFKTREEYFLEIKAKISEEEFDKFISSGFNSLNDFRLAKDIGVSTPEDYEMFYVGGFESVEHLELVKQAGIASLKELNMLISGGYNSIQDVVLSIEIGCSTAEEYYESIALREVVKDYEDILVDFIYQCIESISEHNEAFYDTSQPIESVMMNMSLAFDSEVDKRFPALANKLFMSIRMKALTEAQMNLVKKDIKLLSGPLMTSFHSLVGKMWFEATMNRSERLVDLDESEDLEIEYIEEE